MTGSMIAMAGSTGSPSLSTRNSTSMAPSTVRSPWARLMKRTTPNISDRPAAMMA